MYDLVDLSKSSSSNLAVANSYQGNSARVQLTLRPLISGGSDDWAKEKAGIKYAYTVELPDDGRHGFVLPASQIEPTGQEVWEGVKNMMNYYSKNLKN